MTIFISGDRPNVAGLVLAGSADFKTELSQSDMFDQRLQAAILAVVDVSYGARPSQSTAAAERRVLVRSDSTAARLASVSQMLNLSQSSMSDRFRVA